VKKELIISKIETSQDIGRSLLLEGNKDSMKILFGVAAIPITSSDDLKNLPKKIYDVIEGAFSGGSSKDNLSSESPPLRRIQVNTSSLV
jgi:hypothetical protein